MVGLGWAAGRGAEITGYIADLPLGDHASNDSHSGEVIQMDINCSGLTFRYTETAL